ncbi:triphosphoribosyl-dephospho-CoA synthase MdcB [Lichenibacterium dinghuense]|uniref:triphosphoribosyl-dephospho-CoA synthase MdcB n=1 Tax=Lichenibacterium dinghuense TaxID=2895977 RepID=UPI001F022CEF|nr:triphosphoribosyl-dephospho-CoA synthase MdcB [Lichenibacterium sp. 6Y81]
MPLSAELEAPPAGRPERVAALAHAALIAELEAWPKPGLVSLVDSGSHADMDAGALKRSADAIRPFFADLVRAGEGRAGMAELRRIGLAAEAAMMAATGGVNAHRGAIFSLGLLAAAEGVVGGAGGSAEGRARAVGALWGGAIRGGPAPASSNGAAAVLRFGVGGAREEAAAGFPTLRRTGLPGLREGRRLRPDDPVAARVHCFFALMAAVDDTNLLHRGGRGGLAFATASAARFLAAGGVGAPDWRDEAARLHHAFVARRLSPGGSADLLAATLFLDALEAAPCAGSADPLL